MSTAARVLLVGHGRWGRLYAAALADVRALAGIVTATVGSAGAAAARWEVPGLTDLEQATASLHPDGLAILTPTDRHAEHLRFAIAQGLPAMVIRPATAEPASAMALHARAAAAGVPVLAGHELAFAPPVPRLLELIAQGLIGEVRRIERLAEGAADDGGAPARPMPPDPALRRDYLRQTVMHDLIVAHSLGGRRPVVAARVRRVRPDPARPELDAELRHARGLTTALSWKGDPDLPLRRRTTVVGTVGRLSFTATRTGSELLHERARLTRALPLRPDGPSDQAGAVVHNFLAVLRGAPPGQDLRDAAIVQAGAEILLHAAFPES